MCTYFQLMFAIRLHNKTHNNSFVNCTWSTEFILINCKKFYSPSTNMLCSIAVKIADENDIHMSN